MKDAAHLRRHPRFTVELEIQLQLPEHRIPARTRDVSKSGMFVFIDAPPPSVDSPLDVIVDDGMRLRSTVRNVIPGVGVGLELSGGSPALKAFSDFVESRAKLEGAWAEVGSFVRRRRQRRREHGGVFHYQLPDFVRVGERRTAVRIILEQRETVSPAARISSALAERVSRVSAERVRIRLHEDDKVRECLVGAYKEGGYFALLDPDGACMPYSLSGVEYIMVSSDGVSTYPYFDNYELMQVRADVVESEPTRLSSSLPFTRSALESITEKVIQGLKGDGQTRKRIESNEQPIFPRIFEWMSCDPACLSMLDMLFDVSEVENRTYEVAGEARKVRLLGTIGVTLRGQGLEPSESVLFHDGKRYCAIIKQLGLVRPLEASDEMMLTSC